ncbi:calmodulin-binding protein [Prunus dulcis]|uniref:Calmodulin-binding protein n=1 Tax=Prunus dulcis TaxID=3755 RepID=A0A4Y1QR44_PRUDU|nr:calmodulin-binding protein [Prunus dulcis]
MKSVIVSHAVVLVAKEAAAAPKPIPNISGRVGRQNRININNKASDVVLSRPKRKRNPSVSVVCCSRTDFTLAVSPTSNRRMTIGASFLNPEQ